MASPPLLARRDLPSVVGVAVVVGYVAGVLELMDRTSFDTWGGAIVAPVLGAVAAPMVWRVARKQTDPRLTTIIVWGFWLKYLCAVPRYLVNIFFYHGVGDSYEYATHATTMLAAWHHGQFLMPNREIPGSGFIDLLTTVVYGVTGQTVLGADFVFSVFGFCGIYACFRAVQLALPDIDHVRYGKLLFFLPSLLFWPSSVGKDAWMLLGIGIGTYGAAKLYRRRRGGWLLFALGCGATAVVRPHMTAILFAAVAVGFVVRKGGPKATTLTPIGKTLGVVILVIGGVIVLQHMKSFLKIDSLDTSQVTQSVDFVTTHTAEGGSSFTPHPVSLTDPTTFPFAIVTVLYRPFVIEAHNLTTLVAALESTFVLLLTIWSWRRLANLRRYWRDPLVVATVIYTLLFVFAYSTFGNFGILSRERCQELPFFLVLLALPRTVPKRLIPWGER